MSVRYKWGQTPFILNLTGALRERNGRVHPLSGMRVGSAAHLTVTDIPTLGDTNCSLLTLTFARIETNAIRGEVGGRCYGTVSAQFVLTRVSS